MPNSIEILLVEDMKDISAALSHHLERQGWKTDAAFSCTEALEKLESKTYDLILLDIELPDGNGIHLCEKIRKRVSCPIAFLSGKESPKNVTAALQSGGDIFIRKSDDGIQTLSKSQKPAILISSIEAILRREKRSSAKEFIFGRLKITLEPMKTFFAGKDLDLSVRECQLMLYIAQHPEIQLSREDIGDALWGSKHENLDNISVHVMNIRRKFPVKHDPIITRRRAGYRFNPEAVA